MEIRITKLDRIWYKLIDFLNPDAKHVGDHRLFYGLKRRWE